jgi:hypothetical protein
MLQKAYVYINIFLVLWYRFVFCRFGHAFYIDPIYQLDLLPLKHVPQNPRISRGLQAMNSLDLYAPLLDFTCHYPSDSVCVYIGISIPQIVENPTLQQNCGHTYEIGVCFNIFDNFLCEGFFFFSRNPPSKKCSRKKFKKKKSK